MNAEPWLIVGLGNPGSKYAKTRHNIGFVVVDRLQQRWGDAGWRSASRFAAEVAKGAVAGQRIVLAKPQTYMNLSGNCVQSLVRFYRTALSQIVVVHDDVDLDLGRLKVKRGGGDGGHKGLLSIRESLGSGEFGRVRVGVGRPDGGRPDGGRPDGGDMADYVLRRFDRGEEERVADVVTWAEEAVALVVEKGIAEAMNRINGRDKQTGTASIAT